jgi:hypothetical protein
LVAREALRVVCFAPAEADRCVRRADDFVAVALRFVALRLRVAAAFLAAACRCDLVCVAMWNKSSSTFRFVALSFGYPVAGP